GYVFGHVCGGDDLFGRAVGVAAGSTGDCGAHVAVWNPDGNRIATSGIEGIEVWVSHRSECDCVDRAVCDCDLAGGGGGGAVSAVELAADRSVSFAKISAPRWGFCGMFATVTQAGAALGSPRRVFDLG